MIALLASLAWPARADDEPLVTYIVTETTSCDRLAAKLWGDRDKFPAIHAHNDLGPLPHRLLPGTRLVIPVFGPLAPDATVSRAEGRVDARAPREPDWRSAPVGTALYRAWRVFSRAQSAAELTYRDTSQILLRENTVVVIYGPSAGLARITEAELESGALRARLGELAGGGPLVVRTESAESELVAGRAVLAALDGGRTAVSNHEGKPVKVRARRAAAAPAVAVDAGMGTDVERGQEPAPPRPLPAEPEWIAAPTLFVGGDALASWKPVAGAAGYRVELARDAAGDDVVGQVTVGAAVTAYVGQGLPVGVYHLAVSALDAGGLEGRPSARLRLVVASAALAPGVPAPTVGAVVLAPPGQTCAVDGGVAGERVLLRREGRARVRCGDETTELEVGALPVRLVAAPDGKPVLDGPGELVAALQLVVEGQRASAVLPVEGERLTVATLVLPRPPERPRLEAGLTLRGVAYHGMRLGDNGVPDLGLLGGVRVANAFGAWFAVEAEIAAGTLRFGDDLSAPTLGYAGRLLARLGRGRVRALVGPGMTVQEVFRSGSVVPAFRYGPHVLGGVEMDLGARWRVRADVQPWLSRAGGNTGVATWVGVEAAVGF